MGALIGIDLNGIRDTLARCDGAGGAEPELVDLGVRSGFIRLQSGDDGVWLGGPQTELAPHGRGPGWGPIGVAEGRMDCLDILQEIQDGNPRDTTRQALGSALPGLLGKTDSAVFAVPDAPTYDEAFRDRFLGLLERVDGLRPLLLWRPVAALLGWMDTEPPEARPGCRVAILSLMADGIHLSALSLKRERHGGVSLLVPQRSECGLMVGASFRGRALLEGAQGQLAGASGVATPEVKAAALSPWRFAAGTKPQPEIARLSGNRGWRKLPPLDYGCPRPNEIDLSEGFLKRLRTADILLVEGPLAGNAAWRDGVLKALNVQPPDVTLCHNAVARGCLAAAIRRRLGQPIYFDFLPQLQINALVGRNPEFVDLIVRGARCQGGESFRASAPGEYAVAKGADELTLWLFKEDFVRGRKSRVRLPTVADRWYRLSVSVEQIPGQGFAEVRISSSEFSSLRQSPITLDWEAMEETDQPREEILRQLTDQHQAPLAWPETAVTPGHPALWQKGHPRGDLVAHLRAYRGAPLLWHGRIDSSTRSKLEVLLERFRQPYTPSFWERKSGLDGGQRETFRALRSDGRLPDPIGGHPMPASAAEELDRTLEKLENDLAALKGYFGQQIESRVLGDVLGFASWCFWRCPPSIADVFLGTYDGRYSYDIGTTLLCQGVARVVEGENQLKRYFTGLEQRLRLKKRMISPDYAGVARVLGTSDKAAVNLNPSLAEHIVETTVETLQDENRKAPARCYKVRFKTSLRMLAALLRHREARPGFLDPDHDPAAGRLLAALDTAGERNVDLAAHIEQSAPLYHETTRALSRAAKRFHANAEIIGDLKGFIRREGGNPNIIQRIDMLDDE